MRGGRAFTKPLPFMLGTNESNAYGLLASALAALQPIDMEWCRCEVPWNYSKGSAPAFESTPGTYSSSAISFIVSQIATMTTYGFKPLLTFDTNAGGPGLASTYTSGVPVTPAQYGTAAGELVSMLAAQGLTGLHIEMFNEPDGSSQAQPVALLVEAYAAAYAAMKSADPTCTVHGLTLEATMSAGTSGNVYYNSFVAAASPVAPSAFKGTYWDIVDIHNYSNDNSFVTDASPFFVGPSGYNMFDGLAFFRQNMLSHGDSSPIWMTEVGWPNGSAGVMTPQLQAQFYQNFLEGLSGYDALNGVPFSQYLLCVIQFAADNAGANWGVMGGSDDTSIAIPIFTQLVSGVA